MRIRFPWKPFVAVPALACVFHWLWRQTGLTIATGEEPWKAALIAVPLFLAGLRVHWGSMIKFGGHWFDREGVNHSVLLAIVMQAMLALLPLLVVVSGPSAEMHWRGFYLSVVPFMLFLVWAFSTAWSKTPARAIVLCYTIVFYGLTIGTWAETLILAVTSFALSEAVVALFRRFG